jgi:hypothetical protein
VHVQVGENNFPIKDLNLALRSAPLSREHISICGIARGERRYKDLNFKYKLFLITVLQGEKKVHHSGGLTMNHNTPYSYFLCYNTKLSYLVTPL